MARRVNSGKWLFSNPIQFLAANGVAPERQEDMEKYLKKMINQIVEDLYQLDQRKPTEYLNNNSSQSPTKNGVNFYVEQLSDQILDDPARLEFELLPDLRSKNLKFLRSYLSARKSELKRVREKAAVGAISQTSNINSTPVGHVDDTPDLNANGDPDPDEQNSSSSTFFFSPEPDDGRHSVSRPRAQKQSTPMARGTPFPSPLPAGFPSRQQSEEQEIRLFTNNTVILTCICKFMDTAIAPLVRLSANKPCLQGIRNSLIDRGRMDPWKERIKTADITVPAEQGETKSTIQTPIETDEDLQAWLDREMSCQTGRPLFGDRMSIKQPLTIHLFNSGYDQ